MRSHKNFFYIYEIIKIKLISRYHIDILAYDLELNRFIDWLKILPIHITFRSLQYSIKAHIKSYNI